MKVAIITHFPYDIKQPRGGVEAVSVNLVNSLSKFKDLKINVITLDKNISSIDRYNLGNIKVHRLPSKGKISTLHNAIGPGRLAIKNYIKHLKPDIIHSHDTYGLMVKGIIVPRVFTIHGFIYGDTLVSKTKFAWIRSKIWSFYEKRGWAEQPNIISISPYVRERLHGIATGTIYDIDNPISDKFFNIKRNESDGTVFSAAVISPRKNTLSLVHAVSNLLRKGVNIKLRLAGEITNRKYGTEIKKEIEKLKLNDSIKLLGRISANEIHKELSKASIFALVSLEENSPMGIEESMAAGVPVITSNRCGMPYMVANGESGFLVDPIDINDISMKLEIMLNNKRLRNEMEIKSKKVAYERFHPDIVSKKTRYVYKEIAKIK